MADKKSDPEPKEPKKETGWKPIAMGIAGVLVVAISLFTWHRSRRDAELTNQYERIASHLGEEIELKQINYRQIVDSVTEVTSSDASRASAQVSKANAARARLGAMKSAAELSQKQSAAATQQLELAKGLEASATTSGWATCSSDLGAYIDAIERSKTAQTDLDNCRVKVSRLQDIAKRTNDAAADAQQHADAAVKASASKKVEEAQAAENAAQTTKPDADGGAASPEPVAIKSSDVSVQQQAVAAAADAQRRAKEASAESLAAAALCKAKDETVAARHAEVVSSFSRYDSSCALANSATNNDFGARLAAAKAKHDLAEKNQQEYVRALALAAESDPDIVMNAGVHVLPSYVSDLSACLDPHAADSASTPIGLCLARKIADAAKTEKSIGLSITECPKWLESSTAVALDGASIYIPPRSIDGPAVACGKIAIDSIMSSSNNRFGIAAREHSEAGGFDDVFVLNSDGNVVYPSGTDAELKTLLPDSVLRVFALPGFDPKTARASHMLRNVEIGSEKYRVFLQPISLPISVCKDHPCTKLEGETNLVVCGLVREDRLLADSFQVSPTSSLMVVLLVALAVLSLPLAKLHFIGPKSAFRRFDVALLGVSALVTTLLAVIVFLAFGSRNGLSKRLDDQLANVSDAMATRLETKLDKTSTSLAAMTDGTRSFEDACTKFGGETTESICERTKYDKATDPFNVLFLTDTTGRQRVKVVTDEHAANSISVAGRPYFQRALASRTTCLRLPGPGAECATSGSPEIVRSATTGETVLIVSTPLGKERMWGVGALEVSLPEFQEPVLPLGFQSMVVDADGRIMVDSTNRAQPGQKLFDDVDNPEALDALLSAHVADSMNLRYLGASSRVRVRPLKVAGWSVVTIAPNALVDVPIADTVLVTLIVYGLIAVAMLVLLSLFYAMRQGYYLWRSSDTKPDIPSVSIRPDYEEAPRYARAGLVMIASALALCLLGGLASWVLTIKLLVALPFVFWALMEVPGIGVPGWRVRQLYLKVRDFVIRKMGGEPPSDHPKHRNIRVTYVFWCAGLAGLLVVAPAVIAFSGVLDQFMENLARAEQDHYATELRYRGKCWNSLVGSNDCVDVYGSGKELAFDPKISGDPTPCGWSPMPCVMDFLPPLGLVGDHSTAMLYRVGPNSANDHSWKRTHEWVSLEASGKPQIRTSVHLGTNYAWGWMTVLVIAVIGFVVSAIYVSYGSLERLYALSLLSPRTQGAMTDDQVFAHFEKASEDERRILAQLAIDGYANPHASNRATLKRLAQADLLDRATLALRAGAEQIRNAVPEKERQEWSHGEHETLWGALRAPLSTAVAVLVGIVGVSRPELAAVGPLVPTLAAGLPVLLKVLSTLTGARPTE